MSDDVTNTVHFDDTPFEDVFEIEEELGSGQFAVVRRVREKSSGEKFAAKFIKKRRYATSRRGVTRQNIEREVRVLQKIRGNPNVVELHSVYETASDVIIVLELVSGGELFDHVCAKECLDEVEAAAFIKQILLAVKHLHSLHIVHLDIKPENVMLKKSGETQIKIIDFGLSREVAPGATVKDMVGTPEFVAPEVVNYEPLSSATDMWAVGVVTYILLSGGSPFLGDNRDQTFSNITRVRYHFGDRYFQNTSKQAKDFISRLFVRDVDQRATVEECLQHPWIRGPEGNAIDVRKASCITISHILSFKTRQRWKRILELVTVLMRASKHSREIEDGRFDEDDLLISSTIICAEEGNLRALHKLSALHRLFPNATKRKGYPIGNTAMHGSAKYGHAEIFNYLHMKGGNICARDDNGDTPMHIACRYSQHSVAAYLSNEKIDIDSINKRGETALHCAVESADTRVVKLLIALRPRLDIPNATGDTVIHLAADSINPRILPLLMCMNPPLHLRNIRDETPLHIACARGHIDCVQSLIEHNVPIDAIDQDGKTALIVSLENSNIEIASMLITNGCDINHADLQGNTALHISSRQGLLSAVQTLCHCAVKIDSINKSGMSPLHLAAHQGQVDIIRILCLARADVTKKTNEGLTPELIALAQEHTSAANLLAKVRMQEVRDEFVAQLYPLDTSLRRIKLKLFGHSMTGKTKLVQTLHSTRGISSFFESMSRRISDHYSPSNSMGKDDGVYSQNGSFLSESNNNSFDPVMTESSSTSTTSKYIPPHSLYTRGIDVQTVQINGCGEFSVWEFGGYDIMHTCYDHFVGNTDCVHLVLFRSDDPTEIQYKQILYWMNFLKGRVTPSEPIGNCGISSRRSKVLIVGTHATSSLFPNKNNDGEYISSDIEAMLSTVRLRFETHFDMDHKLILLDATNPSCIGMKLLKNEISKCRANILSKLLKPLAILDTVIGHLNIARKQHANFPVITWPHFMNLVRNEINPLTGDTHCRQIVQQLQLIGEVVYLRNEQTQLDYVVLNAEWLGTHIIGQLLSAEFLSKAKPNGMYSIPDLTSIFPEITEPGDLMHILDTLQLCAPLDLAESFEFPVCIQTPAPDSIWLADKSTYVYGGVRILPMRGMERSLLSTFPRIQVALRRSMNEFQDPMDAELLQWNECSKMSSGLKEALIRLVGDAVEIKVRGPQDRATSCFYFLEDLINLVEQTACEVAPGIALERHFISPKHLKEHRDNPALFLPEAMMEMQQKESLSVQGTQEEEELFTDVVCFGSRDVARLLTLGIDVGVAELQMTSRCELACLLDPPHHMGRDWSILAVKLQLTDQVPDVDSTGQSLSRTDQLLNEWAIHHPEQATVGNLCRILVELGRTDARDALYRTVPLYLFAPLDDQFIDTNDSGVVSSCHSSSEHHHHLLT
ncbi:unnamed protein product [Caenorhabditis angaria]|uniref:Non-specific serine/threonine protein kinase n=1 Tax=Caenorhabditis angaria TaxID=860376 RepID=A0A9P1MTR9_9PELO|nr:unnamed protein product [Caenorhabditis angaria]